MYPDMLKARPGDSIRQKYEQLRDWVVSSKMMSRDIRVIVNQTDKGQQVYMRQDPPSVTFPFEVTRTGRGFAVGEGFINGILPKIKTKSGSEVEIVDPDGVPAPPADLPQFRPLIVCAEVVFDKDFKLEKATIVVRRPTEIPRAGSANLAIQATKMTGLIPLAFMRSSKFTQFVFHNLQVRAFENQEVKTIIYYPS